MMAGNMENVIWKMGTQRYLAATPIPYSLFHIPATEGSLYV